MRAQQVAAREIERVVHRTSRVVIGNIQRREVVEIVFDFRSGPNTKSGIREDLFDTRSARVTPDASRQWSDRGLATTHRLRRPQALPPVRQLQEPHAARSARLYSLLGLVDFLACSGALLSRQLAKGLKACRQLAFLAEIGNANRVQCGKIVRCVYLGRSLDQ